MSTIALAKGARVPSMQSSPTRSSQASSAVPLDPRTAAPSSRTCCEVVAPRWQLPVGLLWVDGDQRYEAVRRDFDYSKPHLRGKVAFHDAIQPTLGPVRLIDKLLERGFELVEHVQGTRMLRRSETD
jgi:hypothetical protein